VDDNLNVRRPAVFLVALAVGAGGCAWETKPLVLQRVPVAESSRIYAADGTLVATLHAEENRETVPYNRIPPVVRDAVVAIEDERFWQHKGVDPKAVLRAAYANAEEGEVVEGGSTITQQYVKNELLTRERNVRRKIQEAALAYQLEKQYSKERILELYLNTIYFGNGAYGVQAASHEYFGTTVDKVTLAQAALLAGLIRAPSTTDPYDNPDAASSRRRAVLHKMVSLGLATPEAAEAAASEPLVVQATPPEERYPAPYFVERVKRFILDDPRFGETPAERRNLLFAGGLRITTTLDLRRQAEAEAAVGKVLSKPESDPAAALVSLDAKTGFVRAIVGGRDFFGRGPNDKFDLATQGRRPAGSSFKPFVLAAALEKGVPLGKVYDAPSRITLPLTRSRWDVDNYEGGGGGRANLVDATVHSHNTVYAQLILEVGPSDAVATAERMGIASPLEPFPSAVLGTNDVTPFEMAVAYATFANRGLIVPPVLVTKVVAHDGSVLFEHQHSQKRVLKQEVSDAVVGVLQQVVTRGTGVAARIGRPAAGKTGTGQEWKDAWFVGFTPDVVTSVWVGFPRSQVSMVPPTTRVRVTGGSWPAQIWQLYMTAAMADRPVEQFPVPPSLDGTAAAVLLTVPVVMGMPVEQAESALARDGFRAERKLVRDDHYPRGYVVGQTPPGGDQAPGGSTVVLEVSNGPATAVVPDVLDREREEAVARVRDASLGARVVVQQEPRSPGSGSRKGKVWKQSPGGGTRVDRGATVTIWVNPK
jgi:penicillin-binding protein 1A